MSLLMEALKKAEQAKRKATEEPAAAPSPTPALALELTPAEAPSPKPEPVYPAKPSSTAAPALTAAAFTMMTGRLAEASLPVVNPHTDVPSAAPPSDPAPAPKPAPAPQPQIALTPIKPALSIDNSNTVKPASPTRSMPQRRRIPAVWIGAGIAVVFMLIGGGYWYYNSMAQYLTQQATLNAPQITLAETAGSTPAAPAAVPVVATPSPVPAAAKAPPAVAKAKPASKLPGAENTRASSPALPGNKTAPIVPAPVIAPASGASLATGDVAVSVPVPPPAPISVSRDAEQNDTFVALQTAYRAYQSGDDNNAQNLYARVLGRDEHNRDALLGLAAIAVRQKDFVRAQEIYSDLLTLDPKDSIAQAGFVGVSGSFDPLQQEARIKALLEQEPGAPHLLFTYATFLMQQQRWLEAARTLQSALQGQRDNADYAFNLAVSFDHLGQADAAVKYYRAALELSAKQSTRFRPDDVRKRLKTMDTTPRGERSP